MSTSFAEQTEQFSGKPVTDWLPMASPLFKHVRTSPGIAFIETRFSATWLSELIASLQTVRDIRRIAYQRWVYRSDERSSWLECHDSGSDQLVYIQPIPVTTLANAAFAMIVHVDRDNFAVTIRLQNEN